MALPNDILAQLPLFSWRGLEAPPYDMVSFAWQHEQSPRAIPYVDVEVHDHVRRKSAEFRVRMYFCEVLRPGAFSNLWPQWLEAIKDGSPDTLVHPLLGGLRARVTNVSGEVKAQIRDGVIVEVGFIETNEDPSLAVTELGIPFDLTTMAETADSNAAEFDIGYPDNSFGTSLAGAIGAIKGAVFSLNMSIEGAVNQVMGNVETMIDAVKALQDHSAWPALDALYNVWWGVRRIQQEIATQARPVASVKLLHPTTLDAFAREMGNTLQDVMGLNVQALKTPLVPKDTTLRYFKVAA